MGGTAAATPVPTAWPQEVQWVNGHKALTSTVCFMPSPCRKCLHPTAPLYIYPRHPVDSLLLAQLHASSQSQTGHNLSLFNHLRGRVGPLCCGPRYRMKTVGRLPWIPPGTGHMNIAFTCHLLLLLLDLLCICPEAGMAGLCTTQLSADLVQALLQSLLTLLVRCLEWGRRRRAVRRKRNWALISKEVEEDKVFNMTEVSPVWLVFGLSFKTCIPECSRI